MIVKNKKRKRNNVGRLKQSNVEKKRKKINVFAESRLANVKIV